MRVYLAIWGCRDNIYKAIVRFTLIIWFKAENGSSLSVLGRNNWVLEAPSWSCWQRQQEIRKWIFALYHRIAFPWTRAQSALDGRGSALNFESKWNWDSGGACCYLMLKDSHTPTGNLGLRLWTALLAAWCGDRVINDSWSSVCQRVGKIFIMLI